MTTNQFITVEMDHHVGVLTFSRPPLNFLSTDVVNELTESLATLDDLPECRATVLCAEGDVFCAGGEFGKGESGYEVHTAMAADLYAAAMKLFEIKKPMVAAIQGAAVGGGLGLALVADFRVSCASARFSANFTRLGMHPGFGTSITLPRLVGQQAAQMMFYTGSRINGQEAFRIGLVDQLVEQAEVKDAAIALAQEIAGSAPIAVQDTHATMRQGLAEQVVEANRRELALQKEHMATADFAEGLLATAERRIPEFSGS